MVGAGLLDCRHGNFHTNHHRHAGHRIRDNLEFLQLVIGYVVARVILCIILIPQYFRGEFYTAYQLLERRFGTRTKSAAASIFVVTRALAEGVRFAAIGKVVSIVLGTGDRVSVAVIRC